MQVLCNKSCSESESECFLVRRPTDNHSPDKALGIFVLILHYLTLPYMFVVSLSGFDISCRLFQYPLKSVPVHFSTLGSPLWPASVLYEVHFGHFLGPLWSVPVNRDTPTDYLPYPTVFILITILSLINAPSHCLWEKGGQMPYKVASRHWNLGILPIFNLKNVILGLLDCIPSGRLLE